MSAHNSSVQRMNSMSTSSMMFSNTINSPQQHYPLPQSSFAVSRQLLQNPSSDQQPQPPKCITTQSVIFAPRSQGRPTLGGISKLEGMARPVNLTSSHQFPSQKRNSCDKAPFMRTGFPGKQFPSHFTHAKQLNRSVNTEEEKQNFNDFQKKAVVPHQRKDSMDTDSNTNHSDDKFKLTRVPPFQPILSNQNKNIQKNDCQSTNSGSGQELIKPKQFDFLKKKKDTREEGHIGSPGTGVNSELAKTFNPMKRSEHMWPLSISPSEQKMPKGLDQENSLKQSTSSTNESHPIELARNMEFRKKKNFEINLSLGSNTPQSRLETPKFTPVKSPNHVRFCEKEEAPCPIPSMKTRHSVKPQRVIGIDDFDIINKLGKGAFGDVFIALEKTLGMMCVLKKMSKKRIREAKVEEHIIREIKLQTYLCNEHITSLYGFFHDDDYLYLIMELLPDGSLQQIKKKKKLPQKQTTEIVKQVAKGLKYLHQEFIIHRDLKPQNLFLNEGYVKIGDFGCSIYHNATGLRNTIVGCLEYSSPEQLSKEGYTDKIDSWSVGILTYELLFGKSPFQSDIKKILMAGEGANINTNLPQVTFPTAPAVSEEAKVFILNLLDSNPDRRMDMDEVMHHSFLKETQY